MKREFAAITAALLILCGCSAKKVQDSSAAAPAETETTSQTQNASSEVPMNDADAPVHMETVPSGEIRHLLICRRTYRIIWARRFMKRRRRVIRLVF